MSIIAKNGDNIIKWASGTILKCYIMKSSFKRNPTFFILLSQYLKNAINDWESTCGIKFLYLPDLGEPPTTNGTQGSLDEVLFCVKYNRINNGQTYASSFFPDASPNLRVISIYPLYFDGLYDQVGLLRHELGHIMGFRHECEHPKAVCGFKSDVSSDLLTPITEYDPSSVMHSPSDTLLNYEMKISELDKQGAQFLYGNPLT